jgi:general secretion pathway protein C
MIDSALNNLRQRIARNGPALVSLALAALIAAELARAALSLLHAPPVSPRPEVHRSSQLPGRQERVDVKEIMAAHLFGIIAVDPNDTESPQPTTARLVLDGTIATDDPNHGVAIISDDSRSKVYSVGQNVAGTLLHAVYLDHVLLNRNGRLETLALPRLMAGAKPAAKNSRPRQDTAAVQSSDALDAPRALTDLLQVTPTMSNGTRAYRVLGGGDDLALQASGLRMGDLMTAINGAPLEDPRSVQRAFDELHSGPAVVTVMRRGRPTNINVNLGE